jgi:hypothetical protein
MDFHKLQQKLFQMDPTDPREDLAKLQQAAQGGSAATGTAQPTKNYLQETAEVTQGSLELDKDYSVSDFAALAGVVTEGKQKTGSAGQAKGKDPMPKAEPGRTKHPLKDKLVGETSSDRVTQLEARVEYLEGVIESLLEGKPKIAKPSNPVAKHMNTYNKASVVPDKKKDAKSGKMKHKGKEFESIKEELYKLLDDKK